MQGRALAMQIAAAALVVALSVATAGIAATFLMAAVCAYFSLPGLALFGMPIRAGAPALAIASATGIAISLTAMAVIGHLCGGLDPLVAALVPGIVALLLREVPFRPPPLPATDLSAWAMLPVTIGALSIALPFLALGVEKDGFHWYTSFFNADFFKHLAYINAVAVQIPPTDPFSPSGPIHYYWLAYILPGTAVRLTDWTVTAEAAITALSWIQCAAMAVLLYAACRAVGASKMASALAASIGLLSPSLDGLAVHVQRGAELLEMMGRANMEGYDLLALIGLPTTLNGSTLYRLMLYVQQHQLAICMIAAWCALFCRAEDDGMAGRIARNALLIPLISISTLIGGLMAGLIPLAESIRQWRQSRTLPFDFFLSAAAGLALAFWLGIVDLDNKPLIAKTYHYPLGGIVEAVALIPIFVMQVVTTFGVFGLLGVAGAIALWRRGGSATADLPAVIVLGSLGAILASRLLHGYSGLVMEVHLKLSFIAGLGLVMATAWLLTESKGLLKRPAQVAAIALLLIAGLPSVVQDIAWHSLNHRRVTTVIPSADMAALTWIRTNLPPDAVLQQYPSDPYLRGGKDSWVPIFAARRVHAAPRGTNLAATDIADANAMFSIEAGADQRQQACGKGIGYFYASRELQPAEYDALVAQFQSEGFATVYGNAGASVWKVCA